MHSGIVDCCGSPTASARASAMYLVFFDNPNAELPGVSVGSRDGRRGIRIGYFQRPLQGSAFPTDRSTGTPHVAGEHGLELFSGGEGHGEPPGIDWAHDYVDEGGFQKLCISLWDACPDYHVVCGPL